MRIAVDARQLVPPITGIGRYTESLLRQMLPGGDEWFLYSDRPLSADVEAWSAGAALTQRHGPAGNRGIRSLWRANVDFARWAREDDIQVFWSPRHHLPLTLSKRIASVVSIHDLVWRRHPETMPRANRLLEWLAMSYSLRRAQRVIAVSEFTQAEIAHFYLDAATKTCVVHEAARELGPAIDPALDCPYFLFVGTLEPRKNLPRLLEAFAGFARATDCPHQLVIIGAEGWGLPSLTEKSESLGISGRVHFPGFIEDSALAGYYQSATALLLPSLYEGFGLPVVEAMRYGTPAIVSDRSSLPEVAGDAGLLVDPESTDALQSALTTLATDADRRALLSSRCLARSEQFSWQRAAAETLDILHDVGGG